MTHNGERSVVADLVAHTHAQCMAAHCTTDARSLASAALQFHDEVLGKGIETYTSADLNLLMECKKLVQGEASRELSIVPRVLTSSFVQVQ